MIHKVQIELKIRVVKLVVCVFRKLNVKNNKFADFFRNINYSEGGKVYIDSFGLIFFGNKMPEASYFR